MDTASTEQRVIVSDKYPVPDTIDAINVKEGTRYEKDHLTISANYKVIKIHNLKLRFRTTLSTS
jgi:hypothetical protein